MKNVQIKGMNVELYDSIEDLPIMRFHKYNKMLLVDAGVGSRCIIRWRKPTPWSPGSSGP